MIKFVHPKTILLLVLCSELFLFVISIKANAPDTFGYGAKGVGLGGARNATVDDWTSVYYNIAGLTHPMPIVARKKNKGIDEPVEKIRILRTKKEQIEEADKQGDYPTEVGFGYLFQISSMTIAPNGNSQQVNENIDIATKGASFGFLQLGLAFDVRNIFNIPGHLPVKFGLGISIRDNGTIAAVNDVSAESYNFVKLNREAQRIVIMSGLSVQAWKERLSVGLGVSVLAGGNGQFKMDNVIIDPSGKDQIPAQEIMLDLTPAAAPTMGVQYRQRLQDFIKESWARDGTLLFGTSWRGELYMELDPLKASATTQLLAIDLPIRLGVLDFYTPHILTWGIAYLHDDWLKAELDLELQLWKYFKLSDTKSFYYSQKGIKIDSFENIFLPRLGAGVRPGKFINSMASLPLWARMGYSYIPAFTPDQKGETNFLDNSKHILSLGASYVLEPNKYVKNPVEVSAGMQFQIWSERESKKQTPKTLNPSYSYRAKVFILSLSIGTKF